VVSQPSYFTIVVADIEKFSQRDNVTQDHLRKAFYRVVPEAFGAAGVSWRKIRIGDRGDGALFLVPAEVPKVQIVDVFVDRLHILLGHHNRQSSQSAQMRLRVSIHAGEVTLDEQGRSGGDTITACRLVDSDVSRACLAAAARAHLVLVVSAAIFNGTVRHGHGAIDPETYARVHVAIKELSDFAWVHVPGYSTPPVPAGTVEPEPAPPAAAQQLPFPPSPGAIWIQTVEGDFVNGIQVKMTSQHPPRDRGEQS
jgi:hypothetical protein